MDSAGTYRVTFEYYPRGLANALYLFGTGVGLILQPFAALFLLAGELPLASEEPTEAETDRVSGFLGSDDRIQEITNRGNACSSTYLLGAVAGVIAWENEALLETV